MSRRTIQILVPLVVLGLAGTYFISQNSGQKSGEQTRARLELVWPSLTAMPGIDRALVGGFAVTCHLDEQPAEAAGVVACLRQAAAKPDAIRPKDMDQAQASARLETLISQAQDK